MFLTHNLFDHLPFNTKSHCSCYNSRFSFKKNNNIKTNKGHGLAADLRLLKGVCFKTLQSRYCNHVNFVDDFAMQLFDL